jgi:hypothetical protein
MPPGDVAPVIMMTIATFCVAAVMIFRGPIGKALGRRLEGPSGQANEELTARVAELEHRLRDVEHDRETLAELAERVDFAERLLAAPRDAGDPSTRGRV